MGGLTRGQLAQRTGVKLERAKDLGFSLAEIRELLVIQDDHAQNCDEMRERLQNKRTDVLAKKAELEGLEMSLRSRLGECDRQ